MSGQIPSDRVLCVGRLYCDLVFTGAPNLPAMGTETFSEDVSLHAGGGVFITAAAFSALGWKTAISAVLPAAPFSDIVRREIDSFNLDATYCTDAIDGASPQVTIAISGQDDRAFLSNKSGAALPKIDFRNGPFRHLHIGELRTLVEHPELLEMARDAEMTISVDCGWDSELLGQGAEMAELLSKVDVFLPNEAEYNHLIASGLPENTVPLSVIKCGGDGATALAKGKRITQAVLPVTVLDATGAGDAFNGGFLSSWLSGKTLEDCLSHGNLCGRAAVQRAGGTGGLADLHELLPKIG